MEQPGAAGCWWHRRAVAMQSCLMPCPGVTLPREACQDWRRIPRGLQRAGSQAACPPVCPTAPTSAASRRAGDSPKHQGQPPPLPHSPHLSVVTPQKLLSTPNYPQWGTGFPGEGHQAGSCRWVPGSFPAPTHAGLFPPPPAGGALPVSAVTPPVPTHAIRPRDGSRPTGLIHPPLPHRISHMAAAGTGRGRGGGAARTVSPAELSPEINPPASARGGAGRGEMPARQPPRHRHPHRHVPSPGTVTSHRARDTLGWAGG